jgi:hypothetical protein
MAQLWFDTPMRSQMTPDDMRADHMRTIMYSSSQHPMPLYPMSPYGMGGLGDFDWTAPGALDRFNYGGGVPDIPTTPPPSGTYWVITPKGTVPVDKQFLASFLLTPDPSYGNGSKYGFFNDALQAFFSNANFYTTVTTGWGTQTGVQNPTNQQLNVVPAVAPPANLTPSAAPTQAPGNQPGNVPATGGVTPASQTIPQANAFPGGMVTGNQTNGAAAPGTIFGMSQSTFGLIAAGLVGLFLLSKGDK